MINEKNIIDAIDFLENALKNNHCIDIFFVMSNFKLNRKYFEICIKLAEERILK